MVDLREYITGLKLCAKEHENEKLFTGQIDTTALCNDTAKLLENDVVERSEYNKLKDKLDKIDKIITKYQDTLNNFYSGKPRDLLESDVLRDIKEVNNGTDSTN